MDTTRFRGHEVVIFERVDGESVAMSNTDLHVLHEYPPLAHTRGWVRQLHRVIKDQIPDSLILFGRNIAYRRTTTYFDVPSFFILDTICQDRQIISWDQTLIQGDILDLAVAKELYRGPYASAIVDTISSKHKSFVIRLADQFDAVEASRYLVSSVSETYMQQSDREFALTARSNSLVHGRIKPAAMARYRNY